MAAASAQEEQGVSTQPSDADVPSAPVQEGGQAEASGTGPTLEDDATGQEDTSTQVSRRRIDASFSLAFSSFLA